MRFEFAAPDGTPLTFECNDTLASRWVCEAILKGTTYPRLPFVDDVEVIWDAGANCGAASVHFALHHPDAVVHAFEPAKVPRARIEANTAVAPNLVVHPFGLFDVDDLVPLYQGDEDSITGSIHRRSVNTDEFEEIELRAAGPLVADLGERIDILKVDVEGAEVEVLESLASVGALVPVKVLYVEYDSRQARRLIDDLVRGTHELYLGTFNFLDQGELVYLRNDLCDHPGVADHLRSILQGATDTGG